MTNESGIRRLAEVDFPIAAVSLHAASEKPVAYAHPKTLHLWWARRPLAACRAVLLSLLLPDPCGEKCPESFKSSARNLLASIRGDVGQQDVELRRSLLRFIADFANWDVSIKPIFLDVARGLVKAAYSGEPPLVVDPFAGGGSIPLEAMRLGCETFASDLNPVAGLILKCLIEDVPRYGDDLAEKFKAAAAEIEVRAEKELTAFFPLDPDGSKPIAYLWARTVRCEAPDCGAEIPLVRSWWLAKVRAARKALRYEIVNGSGVPHLKLEVFTPRDDRDVPKGTVSRAKATCPCCGRTVSAERVREQLRVQKGGATVVFDDGGLRQGGAFLISVVCTTKNGSGRHYREPRPSDYDSVWKAHCQLMEISSPEPQTGTSPWPDEPLPPKGTLGFRVQNYGMSCWADLFSCRQKIALITLSRLITEWADAERGILSDLLAITASRLTDFNSSLSRWASNRQTSAATFGRQALPMLWDFCETSPLSGSTGSWRSSTRITLGCLKSQLWSHGYPGSVTLADACELPLPDDSAGIWFTDPPYYDAVPYADLSDFFYVWLKRMLPNHPILRDPFEPTNPLTPKSREIVQDEAKQVNGQSKDRIFFEKRITSAFNEGRRVLRDDGIGCVVFAHKTTEGWEALLSGLIQGGWIITGSWPIATERLARLRSQESAALATSVHLICRPRPDAAHVGDWGTVLRELPDRVAEWMERLQSEHIRGADLVFACIGPALEIYSRYSKVVDAEDREIPLGGDPEATEPHRRGYLAYVWEAVGRAALEQVLGTAEATARNGAAGALEEDARLTALFLWTLQSTNGQETEGARREAREEESEQDSDEEEEDSPKKTMKGLTLVFDVVRRFAQPLGIHLDNWEDRIIETDKGIVRLLPVAERGEQLFGQDGADLVADRVERESATTFQLMLFPEKTDAAPTIKGKKGRGKKAKGQRESELRTRQEATTLDRVHAAMLLQASGRTNALRALLQAEQERGPDFLRLANALSALYPKQSEEKRLLDAMLLAVPR